MFKLVNKLWQDDSGAAAAEYALILAIVGAIISTALFSLRDEIAGAIDDATAEVAASRQG